MDINFFKGPQKTNYDTLCEDKSYAERTLKLVKDSIDSLKEDLDGWLKKKSATIIRLGMLNENLKVLKKARIVAMIDYQELLKNIQSIQSTINNCDLNITRINSLLDFNNKQLNDEFQKLLEIKKYLSKYGNLVQHEF